MMTTQWLLGWWNLIFIVPAGLAMLYLGIYTLSGITFGDPEADVETDADLDGDADVDAGADADVDTDIDGDADVDADADSDADFDGDADADADLNADAGDGLSHHVHIERDASIDQGSAAEVSPLWSLLSFLGIGRVPVSIVLMVLLLAWGAVGFLANQVIRPYVAEPWHVALVSLPLAALMSLMATGATSNTINRFMPLNLTLAKRKHELLGSIGEVVLPVNGQFGMINVREASGDLHQVGCRLENGNETLPKGSHVKLVAYSAKESMFYVVPCVPSESAALN